MLALVMSLAVAAAGSTKPSPPSACAALRHAASVLTLNATYLEEAQDHFDASKPVVADLAENGDLSASERAGVKMVWLRGLDLGLRAFILIKRDRDEAESIEGLLKAACGR